MKKIEKGKNVYYTIEWSDFTKYDRHAASRVLPELPGIVFFAEKKQSQQRPLLCYATWREGLRSGMKDLFDENFSKFPKTAKLITERSLYFRYCVVDTDKKDLLDVLYWLIKNYQPEFNNVPEAKDSGRYSDIFLNEL